MMGRVVLYILVVTLLLCVLATPVLAQRHSDELKGTITLSGAWALYPMAVKWAEEFQKIHSKVKIDIAAGGAGKGMADCLARVVDIGMVSREIYPEEINKGAWWVPVTKDAVVATVNENTPVLEHLMSKGVSRETLIGIWASGEIKNWGEATDTDIKDSIHVYTRSDACGAAEIWAKYLGKRQEDLLGIGVYGDPGLAEAVRNDTLGIGFNNINYVYDSDTRMQVKGIRILPIDLNNNGIIDKDEDFYNSLDQIIEAIRSGKYPSPPARDLHFVSQGKPRKREVIEFIRWVLTDGQRYVSESGYIQLSDDKLKQELSKL